MDVKLDEPFGAPKGTVRALLTLVLLGAWIIAEGAGKALSPELKQMAIIAVTYYIAARSASGNGPSNTVAVGGARPPEVEQ